MKALTVLLILFVKPVCIPGGDRLSNVLGELRNCKSFADHPLISVLTGTFTTRCSATKTADKKITSKPRFNDPYWPRQWYSHDNLTRAWPMVSHNVVPVYNMGITGKGVFIAVVDNGVDKTHPDLANNYEDDLSFNPCTMQMDATPWMTSSDSSHGTQVAGVVAMVADNKECGVGVAYGAKVAGIVNNCQGATFLDEARSLNYKLDRFDIYINAWGAKDDGRSMEEVNKLVDRAFHKGIAKGRKGKGALYLFAAGNGGEYMDHCGADGLVNHISTIPISADTRRGEVPRYAERCAAIFATAYSTSGGEDEDGIVAPVLNGSCDATFSGTSAAVPIAAGILALVLEANSELTYRDVMHIITLGSDVTPLTTATKDAWVKNAKGFWISTQFGFGLLNALNMVNLAKVWKTVPEKTETLNSNEVKRFEIQSDGCESGTDLVLFLEHVELKPLIKCSHRGSIIITLTSPQGTEVTLLEPRPLDLDPNGLLHWNLLSVHHWGEDPRGIWIAKVAIKEVPEVYGGSATGSVHEFTLILHGTSLQPAHFAHNVPRTYT